MTRRAASTPSTRPARIRGIRVSGSIGSYAKGVAVGSVGPVGFIAALGNAVMWDFCYNDACFAARLAFNVSMVMFAVSYAVRDVVWLRLLAVVAGVLGLPYFVFCCGSPKWDALCWNGLFTLIHLVRLATMRSDETASPEPAT